MDTRDRPDLADTFPETRRSPELATMFRAANRVGGTLVSIACDVAEYESGDKVCVGGYLCVSFRDLGRAASCDDVVALAWWVARGLGGPAADNVHFGFEFTVEPLKHFYGRKDCRCVELLARGQGIDAAQAWHAFGVAAGRVAASLDRAGPDAP